MSTLAGEGPSRPARQRRFDPFCQGVMAAIYGSRAAGSAFGGSWQVCRNPAVCELGAMCEQVRTRAHVVAHARNAVRIMRSAAWARYV